MAMVARSEWKCTRVDPGPSQIVCAVDQVVSSGIPAVSVGDSDDVPGTEVLVSEEGMPAKVGFT